MRWAIETCDIVRIDHFRGFEAYWEIPAEEPTAVHGHWVQGPNAGFFHALRTALGKLPFIAEDLGYITREVHELRKALEIPGMKVLQFGFGNKGAHIYLPHRYEPDCVVYTGTHDNDTMVGWWNTSATEEEKELVSTYLNVGEEGVHWAFIRAALTSVANLCVIPVQDVLGLDSSSSHECSQRNRWQLDMAIAGWSADAGTGGEAGRAGGGHRSRCLRERAFSRARAKRPGSWRRLRGIAGTGRRSALRR